MKLYPAIDLLDGKCVRLKQGCFEESTEYSDDPIETAASFEAKGARYLHVVDLSGAKDPTRRQTALVASIIRNTKLRVQTGGGLRTFAQAQELLDAGADRVVIGSAAVSEPELVANIIGEFGADRLTVALDVRIGEDGVPRLALSGWREQTQLSLSSAMEKLAHVSRVLCTDIGRDGMQSGPNVELYTAFARQYPQVEIQASGGVSSLNDLVNLKNAGIPSVVVGKAIYERKIDLSLAVRSC